jgi:hypothetical protein
VRDNLAGDDAGWSDAGYGLIRAVTVYQGLNLPQTVFFSPGSTSANTSKLYYWTVNDTPFDPDAPKSWPISFTDRPYDGEGPARERIKRSKRLTFWGTSAKPVGTKIGTATFNVDNGWTEPYDVKVKDVITTGQTGVNNVLFEIEPTPMVQGRLFWVDYKFDDPSLVIQERLGEYEALT